MWTIVNVITYLPLTDKRAVLQCKIFITRDLIENQVRSVPNFYMKERKM